MDPKERTKVVAAIQEDLSSVVGASGQPEKLVQLTTNIVQGAKRLIGEAGVPEDLSTRSTESLKTFIKSSHIIAKNPRAVDAKAIQELSSARKAVEKAVVELDKWHMKATRRSSPVEELNEVVEAITKPQDARRNSPESPVESERERKLTWDLQRKRDTLLMKMDPQTNPPHVDNVDEILTIAVKGLMRGADELTRYTEGKLPTKDVLLEPMALVTDMVCKLLDVVDNLFVSKYPMRSQVYSFCTALMDNVLAFGCRSKSDDITSLRNISTQTPALLNAAKVMVEQCEKRSNSLQESINFSMKRVKEFDEMDKEKEVPKEPEKQAKQTTPEPPKPPKPEPKQEYEICCNVCTSVAVDQKTQQPISKGTELSLMVLKTTTVKDVKQDLASRTGLPYENIQFNQGQVELSDSVVINPQSPLPFFLFNRFEPTEEEIREIRKGERRQKRLKIYDLDWSQVKGPIAVALYEYDTLGDESNLAFDEGDVIEIIEKGGDGWWEGSTGDKTGSFPASFVEEIQSKEEGIRLLDVMKRGNKKEPEEEPEEEHRHISRQTSDAVPHSGPNLIGKLKKRGMSVPDFNSQLTSSDKNRVTALFQKKKNKRSGYNNLTVFEEEEGKPESPDPAKPSKAEHKSKSKPHLPIVRPKVLGEDSTHKVATPPSESPSPDPQSRPLPQMNYKRTGQNSSPKLGGTEQKRRPPPPRPPPFAKTHPTQAAKLDQIIRAQNVETEEVATEEAESLTPEPTKERVRSKSPEEKPEESGLTRTKESSSMEDLLNNLKEFDECSAEHSYATLTEVQVATDVDYEIVRPLTPTLSKEVVTIKISDYKPDTDDELLDDEELDGTDDEIDITEEPEDVTRPIDGKLFAEDESWNPREWVPSPEPPPLKAKPQPSKKPSWGIDVQPRAKNGPSFSNELTKPKVPPYVIGGSSPQLNRMASSPQFNKGTNSPQPLSSSPQFSAKGSNLPKPFVPGSSSPQLPIRGASSSQDPPLPPPMIISRPRKSPAHSPQLVSKQEHVDAAKKKTPPPVPPPRQKRKPGGTIGGPPERPAPPPPYNKPKKFTSSHSDMDLREGLPRKPFSSHRQENSQLGDRRWTVSQQREQLRLKPPNRSRSPVVQRKTKAVMGEESHLAATGGTFCIPEDGQEFTGIGKQGILLKESSSSSITDWKSRYFQLVEDGLLYYESSDSPSRVSRPLGEIPINRMVKAIPVGEKNQLQCLAILMRYETSIVLGCQSRMELEDWLGSLNQVIDEVRLKAKPVSYMPSIKAAEYCLDFLMEYPTPLDKNVFKLSTDLGIMKGWLQEIEEGERPDLSALTNPSSALCMLKSLLTDGKLGHLVPSEIAKEISQQVKKSSPVRDIQSKLHHLPDELLHILQMFLRVFSKALEEEDVPNRKHKLEVSDLNRMFGSTLFEGLKPNHSLTLLAYLISTHELMF